MLSPLMYLSPHQRTHPEAKYMANMKRALLVVALFCMAGGAFALDLQLKGKVALVTGSTSGIGYATAKALLNEGAVVIINARTQASVDRAAASLKAATGREPLVFAGDMTKAEDAARLVLAHPQVDILVNNVGRSTRKDFTQTTDQDWYDAFEINVMTGVRLARAYLPGMRQRNWGRMIFVSSEAGVQTPAGSIPYGMSKAAVIAVAHGVAEAAAGTNVTSNSVLPGPTRDEDDARTKELLKLAGVASLDEMAKRYYEGREATIKRIAHPDEVAALIVYIASPLSSYTTGAALRVDGGLIRGAF